MAQVFNIEKLVRDNVRKMKPYASARDEYHSDGSEMIFLDANENPFNNGLNRYPDPQQWDVKKKLASLKGVSENQLLLGNGSDEVLDLLFRAFCEPGIDNVITLPPTYGMYQVLANINAVENREVLLRSDNLEPDVNGILEAADEHSKLLFFCSPNNPTGNRFSGDTIRQLLNSFNGLVIIDEAYIDFSREGSWLTELDNYQNLVITQTFSKAYGLAGLRLGICYASSEIISILNKIKPPYNINALTQRRVLEALADTASVEQEVKNIVSERERLIPLLVNVPFVSDIYESDANFVLIRVDDADLRYTQMLKKGFVLRNRSTQPLCSNTLRITIGTAEENKELLTALKSLK
ncbi:MAG: histidinol-phosphate transaminase [Flavobacteriaceae bacterium]|nr:histidinol-phosphate transaminase [Flavobacteriaceae bacterium]